MEKFNNYDSLKEWTLGKSKEEILERAKNEPSLVIKALLEDTLGFDPKDYIEESIVNPKDHTEVALLFLNNQTLKTLFPKDLELMIYCVKNNITVLNTHWANLFQFSANDLLNLSLEEFGDEKILATLNTKDLSINPKNSNAFNFLNNLIKVFLSQSNITLDKDDDEIQLALSCFDELTLEVKVINNQLTYVIENKKPLKNESLMDKLHMIFTRDMIDTGVKYLGVGLTLGILMSPSDALAGNMKDVSKYIEIMNNSLSSVQAEAPAGCEFGAKVISQNGIQVNYEIKMGDYIIDGRIQKIGNISQNFEQRVSKLKAAKGCGLDKETISSFAKKVADKVNNIVD